MYAIEFESIINGNTLEVPAHVLKKTNLNQQVKIIMLMPENKKQVVNQAQDLQNRLQQIGKRCSKLPLLDQRTADEILGYDELGIPKS